MSKVPGRFRPSSPETVTSSCQELFRNSRLGSVGGEDVCSGSIEWCAVRLEEAKQQHLSFRLAGRAAGNSSSSSL